MTQQYLAEIMGQEVKVEGTERILVVPCGRDYLVDGIDKARFIDGELVCIVSNTLEQQHFFNKWMHKHKFRTVVGHFLHMPPSLKFDRIVMMPPLIQHMEYLNHALKFLAPGGKIVTICLAKDKKKLSWLYKRWEDLPEITFGYKAAMVTI